METVFICLIQTDVLLVFLNKPFFCIVYFFCFYLRRATELSMRTHTNRYQTIEKMRIWQNGLHDHIQIKRFGKGSGKRD